MSSYIPIAVMVIIAAVIALAMVGGSFFLGPKKPGEAKETSYECGMTPVGDARERFSVKFYLVAMVFILFDIEAIFLYPWAVIYKTFENKMFAFSEMLVFVVLIVAGFFFVWKKGVLDWNKPSRDEAL